MAKLINLQLIFTEEKLVGDGKEDPYRRVKQWFAPDGTLVLEYDSHLDKTSMVANLLDFLKTLE